jgi:mevalonate kinase
MAMTIASSPGKIILFGEHAVVYGRPAIAAPITQVRAEATVEDSLETGIKLKAPNLGVERWLADSKKKDPFARAVSVVLETAGIDHPLNLIVTVQSSIPIASGLGSGAAMAAAVIRALAKHLDLQELATDRKVSELCFKVEKLLHGTPSGIDNTVVAFEKPVYFIRREPVNQIDTFTVARPLHLLVADTGEPSRTKNVVGDVRNQWQKDPTIFEKLFDNCGRVAREARFAIEEGDPIRVGQLMVENQAYLRQMTVSSLSLERLIKVAVSAGALGAKLSGAGRGGNMIALVRDGDEDRIKSVLVSAGARNVLMSVLA